MLYTSIDNKKIKDIKKLNTKKYRDGKNLFLVEGEHLVLEAYKTNQLKTLILEKDELFPLNIETMYVTNNVLNYISELETPANILGVCQKKEQPKEIGNKVLILDEIQDPGNLGTIIRSAVAFHIDTIILGNNCVDAYNQKTVRASQGMIFHINIITKDLNELMKELKKEGYQIYGTKVTHGKNLKEVTPSEKYAIIMGNEGAGVKPELLEQCDEYLYINMSGECESLNVAIATSIILYEFDK